VTYEGNKTKINQNSSGLVVMMFSVNYLLIICIYRLKLKYGIYHSSMRKSLHLERETAVKKHVLRGSSTGLRTCTGLVTTGTGINDPRLECSTKVVYPLFWNKFVSDRDSAISQK
jgi:hypothetical protein